MKIQLTTCIFLLFLFTFALNAQDRYRSIVAAGSWNATTSWEISTDGGSNWAAATTVPGNAATDIVTIQDANVITLNQNATVAQITVGGGVSGSLYYEAISTIRTLTITGDLTISNGATIKHNQSGNYEHLLYVGGNLTVGQGSSFSLYGSSSKGVKITFNRQTSEDQLISTTGTPTAFDFQKLAVNRPLTTDRVLCSTGINIKGGNTGLQILSGTFEFNSGTTIMPSGATGSGAIWNHDYAAGTLKITGSANVTFTSGIASSTGGQRGTVEINTTGLVTLGHTSTSVAGSVKFDNAGTFNMIAGTLKINGRFNTSAGVSNITGGTILIDTHVLTMITKSTNSFEVATAGTLNMSNGTIVVLDPNDTSGTGLDVKLSGTINCTGGTIQLGDDTCTTMGSVDGFEVYMGAGKALYNLVIKNAPGLNRHVYLTDHTTKKDIGLNGNLQIISGELRAYGPDAASANITLGGSWLNNGTYLPGSTSIITLNGTSAQVTGATFPSSVYRLTLANSVGVTISNPIIVTSTLGLGGNGSYTNLANISGYTGVVYQASVAQITGSELPASIASLTINNAQGVTLGSNTTLTSGLTLTSGILNIGNNILTFDGSATVSGTPSSTAMIVHGSAGEVRKVWAANGSFTYPIGETTGSAEYSPLSVTLNSNNGLSGAYTSVKVTNSKHPSNSASDYLNRYWTVQGSGITDPDFTTTAQYTAADVMGTEANINAAYRSGGTWFTDSLINSTSKTFSLYNRTAYGEITGGKASDINGGGGSGTLTLSVIPEAFYSGSGALSQSDTMKVYLANMTAPYAFVDSANIVIDANSYSGQGTFALGASGTYYIVVKHRNAVETWSNAAGFVFTSGGAHSYNFTTAAEQSYGSNAVLVGSKYCMYSGDVNNDGFIDFSDLTLVDNDSYNFTSGYVATDVNGDAFVDFSDLTIVDNNSYNFIGVVKPGGKAAGKRAVRVNKPIEIQ